MYRSVTENGLGSFNDIFVRGPSARMAVKVSVDSRSAGVCVYSPFPGSLKVLATIVKPVGDGLPGPQRPFEIAASLSPSILGFETYWSGARKPCTTAKGFG